MKGKLCWVWDVHESNRYIDLIIHHDPDHYFPYKGVNLRWINAKPLTKEEIMEFVE